MTEWSFEAPEVQTLMWRGDHLCDWAGGTGQIRLDGTIGPERWVGYGSRFDGALPADDSHHAVIYQRLGTKALLVRDGRPIRELTRSYYHAEDYEYPIAFLRLPDGELALVHCPDEYDQLRIERLSGERLTESRHGKVDYFHSRLAVSPNSKRLLSAGWTWHPWDWVRTFVVADTLSAPDQLDDPRGVAGALHSGCLEDRAGVWLDDDRLVLAGPEFADGETDEPGLQLQPRGLAVYDLRSGICESSVVLDEVAGTLMPLDAQHVVSFYGHPKVIEVATGRVLHRWTSIASGNQSSSILRAPLPPPIAMDPARRRFAGSPPRDASWRCSSRMRLLRLLHQAVTLNRSVRRPDRT